MISYSEFLKKESLSKEELLAWGKQTLVDDAPGLIPSLPTPPMLMFDRITQIEHRGKRGTMVAEQDIQLDAWFFMCHFGNDPVQPGCLGVDAVWQMLGMYCALRGAQGSGRALGCKEVDFFGMIRPYDQVVTYEIEVRRYSEIQGNALVIGNGRVLVDGTQIYSIADARVGVFPGIQYSDYPAPSKNSRGGTGGLAQ